MAGRQPQRDTVDYLLVLTAVHVVCPQEGGDVIFTSSQDYRATDRSLSLHRGEQVIVLETSGGSLNSAK